MLHRHSLLLCSFIFVSICKFGISGLGKCTTPNSSVSLWWLNKTIEHGHSNSGFDLPVVSMVMFHCYVWFPEGFTPGATVPVSKTRMQRVIPSMATSAFTSAIPWINTWVLVQFFWIRTRWAPTKLVYTHFVNPFTMVLFSWYISTLDHKLYTY